MLEGGLNGIGCDGIKANALELNFGIGAFEQIGDMMANCFALTVRVGSEIDKFIVFLGFGTEFFSNIGLMLAITS